MKVKRAVEKEIKSVARGEEMKTDELKTGGKAKQHGKQMENGKQRVKSEAQDGEPSVRLCCGAAALRACVKGSMRHVYIHCCITSHHSRNERTPTCLLLRMRTGLESGPGVRVLCSGSHQVKTLVSARDRDSPELQAQPDLLVAKLIPCYCRTKAPSSFCFLN